MWVVPSFFITVLCFVMLYVNPSLRVLPREVGLITPTLNMMFWDLALEQLCIIAIAVLKKNSRLAPVPETLHKDSERN